MGKLAKKKLAKTDSSKTVHQDGWINILTGLGIKNRDKRANSEIEFVKMEELEAENLYAADDIAARIVDILPNEALREGFKLDGKEEIPDELKALYVTDRVLEAWILARLYGGSGILMVDENMELTEPRKKGAEISNLLVLSKWELTPRLIERNVLKKRFGEPEFYQLAARGGQSEATAIHHSHILRFDGVVLPRQLRIQNQYWGESILNRSQNAIRNYQTSNDSVASAVQDFRTAVFKLKNLADQVAAGNDAAITQRLTLVNLCKSIARAVVIDEDESYENKGTSFQGIADVLDRMGNRLVSSTDIPHTKLLGESPSGLGATGNSELTNWYDFVETERNNYLKPKLEYLIFEITGKEMEVEFTPLWQMDEPELVELRGKQATTDQIYMQNGVYDAEEVRDQRFGGDKYSIETKLTGPAPEPEEDLFEEEENGEEEEIEEEE